MNKSKKEKGNELERAVSSIEKAIFKYNPDLEKCNYEITSNKIINKNGVRYEIDLLVKIIKGNGYDSLFIFECKNHSRKTKWGDVSLLNEKIKILNAQKGFLISNGFSSSSINYLKNENLEGKIEFIEAIDFLGQGISFPQPVVFIDDIHFVREIQVIINNKEGSGNIEKIMDLNNLRCILNGKSIDLIKEIVNPFIQYLKREKKVELSKNNVDEIEDNIDIKGVYQSKNLYIDEEEAGDIEVRFCCTYLKKKIFPKIISRIDLINRGRFLSLELELPERKTITMEISGINDTVLPHNFIITSDPFK